MLYRFFALGGELTDDFEERTSIRAWGSAVGYALMIIALAVPPMIVDFVEKKSWWKLVSRMGER